MIRYQPAPAASWFQRDGTRLAYRICEASGTGIESRTAVVLIHGLGGSPDDWGAQLDALRALRVVMPDLRGFGASSDVPGPYTIERHASDVIALLDHLSLESVAVVGHSMGGAIALQLALDHPTRVRQMMLVNSLADFRLRGIGRWSEYLLRRSIIAIFGRGVLSRILRWRNYPRADQAEIRARLASGSPSGRTEVYIETMRELVRWSVGERLGEITSPTTVVTGELDWTPTSDRFELAERIPNARLEVVAGSRHGTPIGAADAFNALLLEFLAGSTGAEEDLTA